MPYGQADELSRRRAAIAAIYETHFERVARYMAVRIGNISEAEDLASEVFVRAVRTADSYKETGAPMEAWIFRIAHNLVIDHVRSRQRRGVAGPLDDNIPDDRRSVEDEMDREAEVQELHQAMQHLSDAQRQVLALRFGSGLTSEQAAEAMGKNPGAVREMQSAAIKKLRQLLGGPAGWK